MERESRYQEYRFPRETGQKTYEQQSGAKPEGKNDGKIRAILLELKDLEKLPVVAMLLVPIVPERPEEPKERKKTLPEKILEWVIACAKRVANPPSNYRSAS